MSTVGNDFNLKVTIKNHEWENSREVKKVDKRSVKRQREIEYKERDLVSIKKPKMPTLGSSSEKLHDLRIRITPGIVLNSVG